MTFVSIILLFIFLLNHYSGRINVKLLTLLAGFYILVV